MLPYIWPVQALAKRIRRFVMPQLFMRLPARMKRGMASIVKLCEVEMDFCTRMDIGSPRIRKKLRPDRPMENATGIPRNRNTRKIIMAVYIRQCPSPLHERSSDRQESLFFL